MAKELRILVTIPLPDGAMEEAAAVTAMQRDIACFSEIVASRGGAVDVAVTKLRPRKEPA